MRALDPRPSAADALRAVADFIDHLAGMTTYDEAIAEAGGDLDREMQIREEYMVGLDDDFSAIILRARELAGLR